jgi:hypothetical protein
MSFRTKREIIILSILEKRHLSSVDMTNNENYFNIGFKYFSVKNETPFEFK